MRQWLARRYSMKKMTLTRLSAIQSPYRQIAAPSMVGGPKRVARNHRRKHSSRSPDLLDLALEGSSTGRNNMDEIGTALVSGLIGLLVSGVGTYLCTQGEIRKDPQAKYDADLRQQLWRRVRYRER